MLDIIHNFKFLDVIKKENIFKNTIYALLILLMGTLAAQIGTLPITAIMFKKISLVSLVTNMVAIPVSNLAMAMGFLLVFVSLVSGWAAVLIGTTSGFILSLLLKFIDFFAHFNFSFIETYTADYFFLISFYAIVYFLLFYKNCNYLTRILISILIIANYFTYKSISSYNDRLNLTYLDVGNSNSCFMDYPA